MFFCFHFYLGSHFDYMYIYVYISIIFFKRVETTNQKSIIRYRKGKFMWKNNTFKHHVQYMHFLYMYFSDFFVFFVLPDAGTCWHQLLGGFLPPKIDGDSPQVC